MRDEKKQDDMRHEYQAIILKVLQINDGAIIGAASLAKGNIPSNAIVAVISAKGIKFRGYK